jgi:hypothetical protein
VPWVRMQQLRARDYDASAAAAQSARLRERHTEHILVAMRDGISMRTIRRHRLDDPRITDEVRTMLVEAVKERRSKARFRRPEDQRAEEKLATLIRLGPVVRNARPKNTNNECPETCAPAAEAAISDPQPLREAIEAIRRIVCEQFYLREMRDPELTVRSNRLSYVLPRQLAMYIVRHLTGASLEEIGREFGGKHHTTVLHSINRIEAMRRTDQALNSTIMLFVNTSALHSIS